MTITRNDVLHVAKLGRLRLEDTEVDSLQSDLEKILGYVELLSELDLTEIPPTSHVVVTSAPLREDEAEVLLDRQEVLAEAPRCSEGGFAVPAFVEEG